MALAFVGIAFLIFFIDHIGSSIQAPQIIATVAKDTLEAVDRIVAQEQIVKPLGRDLVGMRYFVQRGRCSARSLGRLAGQHLARVILTT